jgi:hypothetical protein
MPVGWTHVPMVRDDMGVCGDDGGGGVSVEGSGDRCEEYSDCRASA